MGIAGVVDAAVAGLYCQEVLTTFEWRLNAR